MRSLRSAFMGSMRAWLPSRRSTAHQRGAVSMRLSGHVRSGRETSICRWYGRDLWIGIPDGCCGFTSAAGVVRVGAEAFIGVLRVVLIGVSRHTNHRDEEPAREPRRGNEGGA